MIFTTPPITDIGEHLEGHPWWQIQDLNTIIPGLIHLVLIVAAVVFFVLILVGGIQWITAGGDKEALSNTKKRLTSALIGFVIVLSAWAILSLVRGFFGLEPFRNGGGVGQFDCCTIVGGEMENLVECCKLVSRKGCVTNRYQSSSSECHKLRIDWDCWARKFEGGQNPDPKGYCISD
ncbi:MAG TPA: pilin [Nevskiaceae bacterium]|nr:pilin [Nevskiaceae bacterium]